MSIWDNIVNGAKGLLGNIEGNPIVRPQTLQGSVSMPQNNKLPIDNAVVSGVNSNIPQQATNANKIAGILQNSPLRPTNWNDGTRQTVSNILLGIGKNALANPRGDVLSTVLGGANTGLQNQIAYKNAMNTLGNYGIDTAGMSPYADYSNFSPEKLVTLGVQQNRNRMRQEIAAANDNTKRLKIIMDGLKSGQISPDEAIAQAKIYGIDFSNLGESNETRKTDSQVELNQAKAEDIKNPKPKVNISIRKGGTTSNVNINHNGGKGGGKKDDDPLRLWK